MSISSYYILRLNPSNPPNSRRCLSRSFPRHKSRIKQIPYYSCVIIRFRFEPDASGTCMLPGMHATSETANRVEIRNPLGMNRVHRFPRTLLVLYILLFQTGTNVSRHSIFQFMPPGTSRYGNPTAS